MLFEFLRGGVSIPSGQFSSHVLDPAKKLNTYLPTDSQ